MMKFLAGFLVGAFLIMATIIFGQGGFQGGFLAGFVVGALSMWFRFVTGEQANSSDRIR